MAVGSSNILGISTPMNFNKPFLSVDIKDFWNRWHISLSTWLRDFVFSRIFMEATKKKGLKKINNRDVCLYDKYVAYGILAWINDKLYNIWILSWCINGRI